MSPEYRAKFATFHSHGDVGMSKKFLRWKWFDLLKIITTITSVYGHFFLKQGLSSSDLIWRIFILWNLLQSTIGLKASSYPYISSTLKFISNMFKGFCFVSVILYKKAQTWDILYKTRGKDIFNWMIEYCFLCPFENISHVYRRHHCRWRAAYFRPLLVAFNYGHWAYIVQEMLWHGSSVYTVSYEVPCPM